MFKKALIIWSLSYLRMKLDTYWIYDYFRYLIVKMTEKRISLGLMAKQTLFLGLFIFVLGCFSTLFAQNNPTENTEKLAASYFASGEYEKARVIYEELLKRNRYSYTYYENYLQCLIKLEDYKEAVKFTNKQSKSFPDNPGLLVDYGWVLSKSGDTKKAQSVFEDAISDKKTYLNGRAPQLSNAFQKRGYIDYAITVFVESRKITRNPMAHTMELAELYAIKGEFGSVFGEYLQYLEFNLAYYEQVKDRLQLFITEDKHYDQLKTELITRLQKFPDNQAYQELLFWTFVQQKDWDGAFVQIRALDLRTGKTGRKLMELAEICLENQAYSAAIKCYENIKSRGKDFPYYNRAETGLLKTRLIKIQKGGGGSQEELTSLANEYSVFLEERGHLAGAENARLDLADLYIHYLNQPQKGIAELNTFIEIPNLSKIQRGTAKLYLADAYLINGEEWEAHLLYKQLEKEFKDEPLGQEAKFQYAKLCYFRGEFEWALTQLEVLKGATTQLISNNAIELALHIIECTGLDTSEEALQLFAKAEMLLYMNKVDECLSLLDSLQAKFTYHEISDNIVFLQAKIAEKRGDLQAAESFYKELIVKYSFGLLVDDALIALARLYEFRLEDKAKAIETYETLLLGYSGSIYSFEARNRYRMLKGQGNPQ